MNSNDKMLLGALREIDNTKSKYSSKLRDSFQKTITRKLYLYPWTVLDLDELSQVRQLPLNTLASEILNQVAQLWQRFPTDRNLPRLMWWWTLSLIPTRSQSPWTPRRSGTAAR